MILSSNIHVKGDKMKKEDNLVRLTFDSWCSLSVPHCTAVYRENWISWCLYSERSKGKTTCMKWTKMCKFLLIILLYIHWRDVISDDACKCSTSLKNSFSCCADKKGEHWLQHVDVTWFIYNSDISIVKYWIKYYYVGLFNVVKQCLNCFLFFCRRH